MNRFNTYLLVAAMAVSGISYATAADTGTNYNTASTDVQAGQQADASTQREIRSTLAKVVNDAVYGNRFDNLNGYLAKADKDRLVDMKKMNVDDLNSAISQFRADFKNKYNQDFDIQSDHFNDALIMAGQDKKSATARLANADLSNAGINGNLNSTNTTITQTNPPVDNTTPPQPGMTNGAPADRVLNTPPGMVTSSNRNGQESGAADNGSTSGKATGPASSGSNANSTVHGNDTNANPGLKPADQNMATNTTVTETNTNLNNGIASAGGITLNLVNEGHIMNAWRLDIPDQISAEQLKQNLVKHIQMLDDQKATWPADVNAAYRATAFHVLQSFSDSSLASER